MRTHIEAKKKTEEKKKKKTVEHSNDYAPDLLTPYFIITVEKKHSTIDLPHCFLFSLPLSHCNSIFYSRVYLSHFTSLSLFQKSASKTRLLKWFPVVNKTINMQTLLRNYVHKHRVLPRRHTYTHIQRRWTQYQKHLCNLMQSRAVALQ